jgi:PST family polysaccharide transporter
LKISFNSIGKIKEYSGYQFGFNFINYFARNLDNLIIGKVWGNVPLAQYDKAYRFMLYPVSNLTHVITPALHPILSEHQDDTDFIYQKYIQVIKILSLLGVFISVFCFWSSEEIIILVYGGQWYNAVPVFKWLSLSMWAQMLCGSAGAIYQSIGKTRLLFKSGLIYVSISVGCILLGLQTGNLEIFSILITCGFIVKFFVEYFFLIKKGLNKGIRQFLYIFIPYGILYLVLFLGLFLFSKIIITLHLSLLLSLVYKLLFSVMLYFFCLVISGQWRYVQKSVSW